jgi:DNA-binding LacI/PurR family transcriptional regulator
MHRKREPTQAVTIHEVAKLAKVSVATVSRVLSGHNHVRAEVCNRVQKAAAQLNYRPNRVARSLRVQRSKFIGLIISDIENPFYTRLVRAVEDVVYARQFSLLLCNSDEDADKERVYIEFMRDERVAGVIASPTHEATTSLQVLIDAGIPVVAVDRRAKQTPVDTVMLDHAKSAYLLAKHLLEHGHRRIGAVLPETASTSGKERKRGYLQALREVGIVPDAKLIRAMKPIEERGLQATYELLSMPNPPTALFTGNNLLTVGALRAIHNLGRSIPKDVSLVGHDELPWTALLTPGITVAAQPIYEMGKQAIELLMARILGDDKPPRDIKLDPQLIVRQSVARV